MAQYQVISDSCSDYTDQEDLSFIRRVPLTIHLDDCLYVDDEKLDCQALVQTMAATSSAPKSACPSPGAWEEAFEAADGDIYVVTLSGELSGSYNSAVVAAQSYVHEHPERRIHVFNSRSAAAGQVLICLKLRELDCACFFELFLACGDIHGKLAEVLDVELIHVVEHGDIACESSTSHILSTFTSTFA